MCAVCGEAITRSALNSPSSRSPSVRWARSPRSAVRMARPYGPGSWVSRLGQCRRRTGLGPSVVALALDRSDLHRRVGTDQHLCCLEKCGLVLDGDHVEARELLG